ncbi:MAG: hypothetical protein ACI93R_003941 [Flavobacteriales bacterium]|jgi:hypothetical protein
MFLIKNDEPSYMLWWKLLGATVITVFIVFAVHGGTLFLPTRGEVITMENRPIMFSFLIALFSIMAALSFWQGGYGLYKKYLYNQPSHGS